MADVPTRNRKPRSGFATSAVAEHLRITLLGRFAVTDATTGREAPLGSSARRIVAFAALHPRVTKRSAIAKTLWPHLDGGVHSNGNLRAALAHLRASSPHLLIADRWSIQLAPGVSVDTWELKTWVAAIDAGQSTDEILDELPVDMLTAELLPGWDDEWVIFERDRARLRGVLALQRLARLCVRRRGFGRAFEFLYDALEVEPLRDSTMCALIEAHLAEGNRAEAIQCFRRFQKQLNDELGIGPSDAMRALMAGVPTPLLTPPRPKWPLSMRGR